ncbi:MAG: SRPBCC family protein [Methyloceanibacter sp.]
MRPIMRLILGLCALAVILLGVAFALPGQVTIARSVVINAPESIVFPYLNDLHRFGDWSPWAARDPELAATFSGPEQGKGAKVEWTSSKPSVGAGSMQITESNPNRHIDLAVNFNGLDGTSYYEVVPSGSGSKVTWGFGYESGTSPLKRWKGLLLDRYVGAEYRDALAKLKDKIESERKPVAPPPPPTAAIGTPEQPSAVAPDGAAAPGTPPTAAEAPGTVPQQAPPAAQPVAPQQKTPAKRSRRP